MFFIGVILVDFLNIFELKKSKFEDYLFML